MALIALTTVDTVRYVSDADPSKKYVDASVDPADPAKGVKQVAQIDEASATIFLLKPLDAFLTAYIYDNASSLTGRQGSDDVKINTRVNQTNIDAVRFGLRGFENFTDGKGALVHFKSAKAVVNGREYEVASDDTVKLLGLKLVAELAGEVKRISEVSSAEEKNSDAASSPSA
jgi:hypothetical protein